MSVGSHGSAREGSHTKEEKKNVKMDKWKYKKYRIHLRWFGHVQRREINALMRNSELIQVKGMKRGKRRQKITLIKVVKK